MMDETQLSSATTKGIISSQLGARLKAAREAMNLSEKDAASRLHLSVKFISMMENGSFEEGLPNTFMRGYLRSYAKLVNIIENEVNAALDQLDATITTTPPPPISPILLTTNAKSTERYIRYVTYVIAVILVALVGTWWSSHSRYSVSDVSPKTIESQPTPTETVAKEVVAEPTTPEPTPPTPTPMPEEETPVVKVPLNNTIIGNSPTTNSTNLIGTPPVQNINPSSTNTTPSSPLPTVAAPHSSLPDAASSTPSVSVTQPSDTAIATTENEETKTAPKKKRRPKFNMALPEPGLESGSEEFAY